MRRKPEVKMTRRHGAIAGLGLGFGLMAALSACSSPDSRFYTLDPLPPAASTSSAGARPLGPSLADGAPIAVGTVRLPDALDRLEVTRRAGPNRLKVEDYDRWAASLDQLTRHALALDLAQRLPAGAIVTPDDPAAPPETRLLTLDVTRFEGDEGGNVALDLRWTLTDGKATVVSREESIRVGGAGSSSSGHGIDGMAAGMSQALAQLADRIAAVLTTSPVR